MPRRRAASRSLPAFALAALLVVAAAAAAAAPADRPLLTLSRRLPSMERDPGVVAAYTASVSLAAFAAGPAEAAFELPGGKRLAARRATFERRGGRGLLWHGRGAAGEEVVLTLRAGLAVGTLFSAERVFQLLPSGRGGTRLLEIDPDRLPGCGGAALHLPGPNSTDAGGDAASGPAPRIDLLVLYTAEVRRVVGSRAGAEAFVQHQIDLTNVSFRNSRMAVRARLAGMDEVEPPPAAELSSDRLLDWLRGSGEVARLRDLADADVVGLLWEGSSVVTSVCGSAAMIFRPGGGAAGRAFFVTRRPCGAGLTFTHEVGHLLGADHNPEDAVTAGDTEYPYGKGHYHDGRYRTLMSYAGPCRAAGCPTQPYFSNPDVRYDRRPTGIRDRRDNARLIAELAGFVARFRTAPGDDGECPLEPGDRDYCRFCGPCAAGEGNCAGDAECDDRLVCVEDAGARAGLPARTDVCLPAGDCSLEPGVDGYCRLCGPCGHGQGDCGADGECQPGLFCIDEAGPAFGFAPAVDVCAYVEGGYCPVPPGDPAFCSLCGPCRSGAGHCRDSTDCAFGLTCNPGVGAAFGFPSEAGVCLAGPFGDDCTVSPGRSDYCQVCGLCDVGEGDCDGDRQCRPGLVCVDGAGAERGFGPGVDVCLERPTGGLEAPGRLRARVAGAGRVKLRWRDRSRDEEGFEVQMRAGDGGFERVATVGRNARRAVVRGLAPGIVYTFRVRAVAGGRLSEFSNQVTVSLPG